MASLIAGNATDSIQTVLNNNSLLASRNSSANNKLNSDAAHGAQKVGAKSNSNVSHSTQVNLTHSQSTSSSSGLYNKYGNVPAATVPSASNADGKNHMKSAHAASKENSATNNVNNHPGTQEAKYLSNFLKNKL